MPDDDQREPLTETEAAQLPLPVDLFEPTREVRPDYNIGKWAGMIFTSPYAKNVREVRTYTWQVTNGRESLDASLTVTPRVGLKTPTTTTLRVYLALVQVWEHQGRPEAGVVQFSARQLAGVIGWRWGGNDTAQRIYEHLKVLSGTSLEWVFAYQRVDATIDEIVDDMSILDSTGYRKRSQLWEPEKFSVVQHARFNPDLIRSMLAGHVRPLNYEAFRQIGNDTTANLYTKLDLYLTKKPRWERRSVQLLRDDLGLSGTRYKQRFARHAKLKEFVAELDGIDLVAGVLRLAIAKTADGEDWKLVARKEAAPAKRRRHIAPVNEPEYAEHLADDLISEILRQPRAGTPRRGYIVFLARIYPAQVLREALSIAKADYHGKVRKSLAHVFVGEVKRLVKDKGLPCYWEKEAVD